MFNDAIDMGAFEVQPPAFYGDFNQDRSIDAADYIVYRKLLGTTVPSYSFADSDGDGSITTADDDAWETSFGSVLDVLSPGSSPASASALNQPPADSESVSTAAAFDEAMQQLDLFGASPRSPDLRHTARSAKRSLCQARWLATITALARWPV